MRLLDSTLFEVGPQRASEDPITTSLEGIVVQERDAGAGAGCTNGATGWLPVAVVENMVAGDVHDGKATNTFNDVSGGIESPAIKAIVVEILEGTEPAFKNRKRKYGP